MEHVLFRFELKLQWQAGRQSIYFDFLIIRVKAVIHLLWIVGGKRGRRERGQGFDIYLLDNRNRTQKWDE